MAEELNTIAMPNPTSTSVEKNKMRSGFSFLAKPPSQSHNSLPQLQRGQAEQRQNQRCDPKANDDFRLAPSAKLEVMVQRRHPEDPLAAKFKRHDLNHHRKRFGHKHA